MHHAFLDAYTGLNTPLHRLSAKLKIIALLFFLFTLVLIPPRYAAGLFFYAAFLFYLIFLSRLPLRFILTRTIEILPFIAVILLPVYFKKADFRFFLVYFFKALLAILAVLLVSSTTRFNQLLEALRALKFSRLFLDLLAFMYRYSFLLEDEFLRAGRACAARGGAKQNSFLKLKTFGNISALVFIRAYERAERVYLAMCARGYRHE